MTWASLEEENRQLRMQLVTLGNAKVDAGEKMFVMFARLKKYEPWWKHPDEFTPEDTRRHNEED